ncbi:MAG: CcmD family protein [Bacteroidales bacterium]|nr:CcmD family protein [Bacteroidales bacterium]
MTPDSKLYIVVAVLAVILIGLFAYLFVMDRKVSRIERELLQEKESKNKLKQEG